MKTLNEWLEILVAIVTIISGIIPIYVAIFPNTSLKSLQSNQLKQILWSIAIVGLIFFAFDWFIIPRSTILVWDQTDTTVPGQKVDSANHALTLSFSPQQNVFTRSPLLSSDRYPTKVIVQTLRDKKVYYVGTYGAGLFRSDNLPEWQALGLENLLITDMIAPGQAQILLVGTNIGLFKSEDNGATWKRTALADLVTTLAASDTTGTNLLAGTARGLFRSSDGGETWLKIKKPDDDTVTSIAISPVNPQRIYVAQMNSVIRSDDGGNSWVPIYPNDSILSIQHGESIALAINPMSPDSVYIGPGNQGLYHADDAGTSWTHLGLDNVSISAIHISPSQPNLLVIGSDNTKGIYFSSDAGGSWHNNNELKDNILFITEDNTDTGSILVTTPNHGLTSTGDYGRTWLGLGFQHPTSALGSSILDLETFPDEPDHLLAISDENAGKVALESADGGNTWSRFQCKDNAIYAEPKDIYIDINNPNHLFISYLGGAVEESQDRGVNCHSITGNLTQEGFAPVTVAKNGLTFAGPSQQGIWSRQVDQSSWVPLGLQTVSIDSLWVNYDGTLVNGFDGSEHFYFSKDSGFSWSTPSSLFRSVVASPYSNLQLIAISNDSTIVTSNDGGENWSLVETLSESTGDDNQHLEVSPDPISVYYATSGLTLKVSRDQGATWETHSLEERGTIHASLNGRIYLSSNSKVLYLSDNYGATWKELNKAAPIFTQFAQLDTNTWLGATQSDGIFISHNMSDTWSQTSIGQGINVAKLIAVRQNNQRVARGLLDTSTGMSLISSPNGLVWDSNPICGSGGKFLNSAIDKDGNENWNISCGDVSAFIGVNTKTLTKTQIPFPTDTVAQSVILISEQEAYAQLEDGTIIGTNDAGKGWINSIVFEDNGRYSLTTDLRSDSLLYDNKRTLMGYTPHRKTLYSIYITGLLAGILALVLLNYKQYRSQIIEDLYKTLRMLVKYDRLALRKKYNWISVLSFTFIFFCTMILIQFSSSNSVNHEWLRLLNQPLLPTIIISSNFPLQAFAFTTQDGYELLGILFKLGFQSFIAVFILISLCDLFKSESIEFVAFSTVLINGFTTLLLGLTFLVAVGMLPTLVGENSWVISFITNTYLFFVFYVVHQVWFDSIADKYSISGVSLALVHWSIWFFIAPLIDAFTKSFDLGLATKYTLINSLVRLQETYSFAVTLFIVIYIMYYVREERNIDSDSVDLD